MEDYFKEFKFKLGDIVMLKARPKADNFPAMITARMLVENSCGYMKAYDLCGVGFTTQHEEFELELDSRYIDPERRQ